MAIRKIIKCKTKTVYRNKNTNEKYNSEKEYLKKNSKEDLVTDIVVEVPDLPMFGKTQ